MTKRKKSPTVQAKPAARSAVPAEPARRRVQIIDRTAEDEGMNFILTPYSDDDDEPSKHNENVQGLSPRTRRNEPV